MGGVGKLMCVDLWLVQGEGCKGQGGVGQGGKGKGGEGQECKGEGRVSLYSGRD